MKNRRYVHRYINRHGKEVWYIRRPGEKKIRLWVPKHVVPWSPAFEAIYEEALNGAPSPARPIVAGTVNAELVSYYQSQAFKALALGTQKNRRADLERFREEHGDKRVAMMHSAALQNIINRKSPAAQRNFVQAMRGFLKHCCLKTDPLAGVELVKAKSTGHHPWEASECEQFEACHQVGTRARLAYELLLQAGQSRCDVVRMGRQHIRNGMLSMRRQKTGVEFSVTVMPRLQAAIDAMAASSHLTFLVTHDGRPFSAKGFGIWFKKICRAAKLPEHCTSHGLRKAAATYLAEQGATDHHLMAWFGWTSISQAQVYTKSANRKRLAASAGKLITGTGIGSPIDPVSQNDEQPIENTKG
jgi:integrase